MHKRHFRASCTQTGWVAWCAEWRLHWNWMLGRKSAVFCFSLIICVLLCHSLKQLLLEKLHTSDKNLNTERPRTPALFCAQNKIVALYSGATEVKSWLMVAMPLMLNFGEEESILQLVRLINFSLSLPNPKDATLSQTKKYPSLKNSFLHQAEI